MVPHALISGPVWAEQGVYEINQLCVATGCFDGDDPGFPVEIVNPGSYRLTSNLNVRDEPNPEDVTAILTTGFSVNLDLNGHVIIGPVSCPGTPASCSISGIGFGILSNSGLAQIHNGTVSGMGSAGVGCSGLCSVADLVLVSNGGNGLDAIGGNNNALRIRSVSNGGAGILFRGLIENSHAQRNGGVGISVAGESILNASTATLNGGAGVQCVRCSMFFNTITGNTGVGVQYFSPSSAGSNSISNNSGGSTSGAAPFVTAPNRCGSSSC
ncbi:MAG: right-handed parallel beta-helix repeat-containing protein [Pseudomonadota bacterium]